MLWNGNECQKNEGKENLGITDHSADYCGSKGSGECGLFQLLG
jgi:hypothetical protein